MEKTLLFSLQKQFFFLNTEFFWWKLWNFENIFSYTQVNNKVFFCIEFLNVNIPFLWNLIVLINIKTTNYNLDYTFLSSGLLNVTFVMHCSPPILFKISLLHIFKYWYVWFNNVHKGIQLLMCLCDWINYTNTLLHG